MSKLYKVTLHNINNGEELYQDEIETDDEREAVDETIKEFVMWQIGSEVTVLRDFDAEDEEGLYPVSGSILGRYIIS